MIADNSSWTTTIPSTVPSGNYLIRLEPIALHSMPAVRSHAVLISCQLVDVTDGLFRYSNSTQSAPRSRSPAEGPLRPLLLSWFPSLVPTPTTTPAVCIYISVPACRSSNLSFPVNIDVYSNAAQAQTTYVIPGPPLYGSAAASSAPAPPHVSISPGL